jgi:hypothetical protein
MAMFVIQLVTILGITPLTHPVAYGVLLLWLALELWSAALWVVNIL